MNVKTGEALGTPSPVNVRVGLRTLQIGSGAEDFDKVFYR